MNYNHKILNLSFVKTIAVLFCLGFLFIQAKPAYAASWLSGWSYSKQITIANTNVSSALSYFPLLVNISGDTDIGGSVSNTTNGYDIRFTDSNMNLLPYERGSFSVTGGAATGTFWVQVPSVSSATSTIIYAYYGNSSASSTDWTIATSTINNSGSGGVNCTLTSVTNAQCVWGENGANTYKGIWHLKEATGSNALDSTGSSSNSFIPQNSPTQAAGQIGGSWNFNGTNQYAKATNMAFDIGTNSLTLGAWVTATGDGTIIGRRSNSTNEFMGVSMDISGGKASIYFNTPSNSNVRSTGSTTITGGNKYYVVATLNRSGNETIYVNGVAEGTPASISASSAYNYISTAKWAIGTTITATTYPNGVGFLTGMLDEPRISSVVRTAGWIKFEYCNMISAVSGTCNGNNELTYGSQTIAPLPSTDATVTSSSYTVSAVSTTTGGAGTIINVPYATASSTFLSAITKNDSNQTWNISNIHNPVVSGDTLVVTAENSSTTATYTVTVNAPSPDATVTSASYTVSVVSTTTGGAGTIINVPYATASSTFLSALTKHQASQTWNISNIHNPVVSSDTLVVTGQDGTTTATYAITVNAPSSDATLSGLTISQGTLSPSFSSGQTSYIDSVINNLTSLTVIPTVNQANATITVNGTPVTSGTSSLPISLVAGSTTISVVVTAQDGVTTKTYTISVSASLFVVNDIFTGTGGTLLTSHAADTGQTWIRHGFFSLSDAKLTGTGYVYTSNGGVYLSSYSSPSADYIVSTNVNMKSVVSAGAAGVVARFNTATNLNGYIAVYDASASQWSLSKYVNTTGITLATSSTQVLTTNRDYNLQLSVMGSALKVYVDGALVISTTDATFASSGSAGVWADTHSTSTSNGLQPGHFVIASNSANQITSFNFSSPSVSGVINYSPNPHTVALTVPYGTNVTSLTPTITVSAGATISPLSGVAQNFTNPVTYTVTAADGITTQQYTVTVTVSNTNDIYVNDSGLYFSPYNWYISGSSYAISQNPGAYIKTNFTGTSVKINLSQDHLITAGTNANYYPRLSYQIDGGAVTEVRLASSTTLITAATGLASSTHSLLIFFPGAQGGSVGDPDRWVTPVQAIKFTGLTLDGGATVSLPTLRPKRMIVYGDSISEGVLADYSGLPMPNSDQNATKAVPWLLSSDLNAEVGLRALGGGGWSRIGSGAVPPIFTPGDDTNSMWNKYSAGKSLLTGGLYSPAPDYIYMNHGFNDQINSDATVTAAVSGWLPAVRAAAPNAYILLVIPFAGTKASAITTAYNNYISANPTDTKAFLINLGGTVATIVTNNSSDGIHPTTAGNALIKPYALTAIQAALPDAITFTFTGPSSGNINASSTDFTVTPNKVYTGTITITPTGTGSTGMSANVLTFASSSVAQTFTIKPTSAGSITLTPTNSGTLTNPGNLIYTLNSIAPSAPSAPTFTSVSTSTLTVKFTAPSDGGSPITNISLYRILSGATTTLSTSLASTTTSYADTGLTANTSYSYFLTATNAVGTSASSTISATTTLPWATTSAPTSLTIASSSQSVTLNWSAPAANANTPITSYQIYQKIGAGAFAFASTTGVVTTWATSTLTNGTEYSYYISAVNMVGESATSSTVTATPVAAVDPDVTAPVRSAGLPSGRQSAGTTQVTMSITTDENATCKYSTTTDTVYASMANTFTTTGTTSHSTIISGLSNGNSYNYYIRCTDGTNVNTDDYTISFSVASGGSHHPFCTYTYSAWGSCLNGSQTRTVTTDYTNCSNIEDAPLTQSCVATIAITTATTTTPVATSTPAIHSTNSLSDLINLLISLNLIPEEKISQARSLIETTPENTFRFTKPLKFGQIDPDAKQLQIFLNSDPTTQVASSGIGSSGRETTYFGPATLRAVKAFQVKYSIAKKGDLGFGLVGPATRAKLNSLIK